MKSLFAAVTMIVVGALVLTPSTAGAQEVPSGATKESDEQRKWVPLFQRHAGEYVVRAGSEANQLAPAQWLSEPVLRWSQPVRGGDDGALYLWLREGRPVAAVTFFTFKWPDGKRAIVHERHSLRLGTVEAEWRGREVWHTTKPGVTYEPVPSAAKPAATASARMRQMHEITRDFTARTVDDKDKDWPLRLLPKPLYRFEGSTHDSLDGALFALAQGTDPEAFLILDARGSAEARRWEYAVARFTDRKVVVQYKDREVYAGRNTVGGTDEVYHSETVILKPSDKPEDFD
ncbi:MAG: hypothetical protein P4L84_20955 [Isosphaeraceae bacterium]|nr:hypothetical protein [Isosphaeraceae bacterium]